MTSKIDGQERDIIVTIGGILSVLKRSGGKYSDIIRAVLTPGYSSKKIESFKSLISLNEREYGLFMSDYTIEWFDQTVQKVIMDSFPLATGEKNGDGDGAEYDYKKYMDVVCRCAVKLNISYESICNYTPLILDSMLSAMSEREKEEQHKTAIAAIQNRIAQNKDNLKYDDLILY